MDRIAFEKLIADEFPNAVPDRFRAMVSNVAFVAEDKPSREVRREEHLRSNETLLGLYRGVPRTNRGDGYGVGATVPDVIILYRLPIHDEAQALVEQKTAATFDEALRLVVRETIWHEIGHYLGLGEEDIRNREEVRKVHHAASVWLPQNQTEEDDIKTLMQGPHGTSPHSSYDPIQVEDETPEMQHLLHDPVLPESFDHSSIDAGGGGDGIRPWWERGMPEKPDGLLPEDLPPFEQKNVSSEKGSRRESKKGEPPPNLPTLGN